jgi:hypothetical protein
MKYKYKIHFNLGIIILLLSIIVLSCKEKSINKGKHYEIKNLNALHLSTLVDSIFDICIKDVPNSPAYAIIIDKKSERLTDFVITVAPFSKKIGSFYASGAANYFMFNDSVPVFIYSGLEDFLISDSSKFIDAKTLPPEAKGEFKNIDYYKKYISLSQGFSYVHHDTSSFIIKENVNPFLDLHLGRTVYYFAPDSLKNN